MKGLQFIKKGLVAFAAAAVIMAGSLPQALAAQLAPAQKVVLNNITVYAFDESPLTLYSEIFPDLAKYPERMAQMPGGEFKTLTRTYLVGTAGKKVLIDSGWGTESGIDGKTEAYLAEYGVPADKLTDILLTHMDVDHISGLINQGKAVYPNATLHIAAKEYNRWVVMGADREPEFIALARRVAKAYEGRIATFEYGDEVLPGITARSANGHTMGHTCYDITDGGAGLTIVGDMIHVAPIQMRYTDYSSVYDVDKKLAAATRERILNELSQSGRLVAGMHFPQIGRVQHNADGGYTVTAAEK